MISHEIKLRPRYDEVDQMGYVYHANYVTYCHQARTELMRQLHINDKELETNNIMIPVISFEINYKKPAVYDDIINIKAIVNEVTQVRLSFDFIITNSHNEKISSAKTTIVFVEKDSRKPIRIPSNIIQKLKHKIKHSNTAS